MYRVLPRARVFCHVGAHAGAEEDLLSQIAAVLAVGARALVSASMASWHARLPLAVQAVVDIASHPGAVEQADAALIHGGPAEIAALAQEMAAQHGPLRGLTALSPGQSSVPLERLVIERCVSTNTAAAGGNATLMTLQA